MSDNNSDDEALKEIDSEGESTEAEKLINEPRENQLVLRTTEEFQLNKAG